MVSTMNREGSPSVMLC